VTSGPENSCNKDKRNVFSARRKVVSDDAARTADGRLFHARAAATENDRSPRVDCLTGGQSELLWLTSAGDGGRQCQLPPDTVGEVGWSSAVATTERQNRDKTVSALGLSLIPTILMHRRTKFINMICIVIIIGSWTEI